jgi:hypothetical protein
MDLRRERASRGNRGRSILVDLMNPVSSLLDFHKPSISEKNVDTLSARHEHSTAILFSVRRTPPADI